MAGGQATKDDPKFEEALTLDPGDWTEFKAVAHAAVDHATDRIGTLRDGPVWRPMPDDVRTAFTGPAPVGPQPLSEVYAQVATRVIPCAMGDVHPRFWGRYMGTGDLTGALAGFLAAVDGSNLGGGNTATNLVDQQVTRWIREMMGFPEGASGAPVSGGSMANIVALTAARTAEEVRLRARRFRPSLSTARPRWRPSQLNVTTTSSGCHRQWGLGLD